MTIEDTAETILANAQQATTPNHTDSTDCLLTVAETFATALALLTSTSKEKREQGKTMVRRWKNGNSF